MQRSALPFLVAVSLLACVAPSEGPSAPGVTAERLTVERMVASPSLTGTAPVGPAWSPDSRHLAFLWNDAAESRREIWIVGAQGDEPRRLTSPNEGSSGIGAFAWLPDGSGLVYLRAGTLWHADLAGSSRSLAELGGRASSLDVSPDGRLVSFLQDGDLWLFDLEADALTRATRVAVPSIASLSLGRYARRDVEIGPYVWGGPTYAWSPDSRTLAVHHVDRRALPRVPFPDYLGEETRPNHVRRGYPGDPNEARRVGLLRVADLELTLLDLPEPTEVRVVDFSWSKQGKLLIDRESDIAVDRWLHVLDPATGELEQRWHDRRGTRVYTNIGSDWHPDGESLLFRSDLGDRYGLWLLEPGSDQPRLLTRAAFDVTGGPHLPGNGASLFYTANEPVPQETHVFRLPLAGGEATRVTHRPGQHRPYPSPDGRRVALLHTDDTTPTDLWIVDADGTSPERRVTASPPPDFHDHDWVSARYVSFPSRIDDYTLHARILEPRDMDPDVRHPVIFGPAYSNTVRNRWASRWGTLQQLLVQRGYIVVQVDVRGSTGYGRDFREEFLLDFAGDDIEDLASAVAYLETLPWVDPERMGIWGSSYGGTLTLYSLLKKPGLFQAGVACASAVDPHFFGGDDVAIVRRPDTHPEAFLRGAAQYAGNLEDHLLIIHGMQDQVVPFKTTVALAEELMLQGKDFDFAFAPAGTHGWSGPPHYARYLFGKLVDHFDRYLAP